MDIKKIAGDFITDENLKVLVVASKFNEMVSDKLIEGCVSRLDDLGVPEDNVTLVMVPGAREIPLVIQSSLDKSKNSFDVVIALGCIIRGETAHFEYVAQEVSKGTAKISLDYKVPVIFGVLTANSMAEALDRSGGKIGNKGRVAAENAVEMANLMSEIENEI